MQLNYKTLCYALLIKFLMEIKMKGKKKKKNIDILKIFKIYIYILKYILTWGAPHDDQATLNFKKCSPIIQLSPKNVLTSKQKYNVPTLNTIECSPITQLSLKNILTSKKNTKKKKEEVLNPVYYINYKYVIHLIIHSSHHLMYPPFFTLDFSINNNP